MLNEVKFAKQPSNTAQYRHIIVSHLKNATAGGSIYPSGSRNPNRRSPPWDRANGWKIPSLVFVSLDAGLRPIEVARATPSWVDVDNNVLRISKEESSKNRDNWVVNLQARTADVLEKWIKQRETIPMYDDSDALWLTRQGNSYRSRALKHLLTRLCNITDLDTEDCDLSWYAIRHSVGTYMTREEGLANDLWG